MTNSKIGRQFCTLDNRQQIEGSQGYILHACSELLTNTWPQYTGQWTVIKDEWHHSQLCLLTHLENLSYDLGSASLKVLLPKKRMLLLGDPKMFPLNLKLMVPYAHFRLSWHWKTREKGIYIVDWADECWQLKNNCVLVARESMDETGD